MKNGFKYLNIEFPEKFSSLECVGVNMLFAGRSVRLFCAYRPPNASIEYSELLFNFLGTCCTDDDSVVCVGDFNLPLIQWDTLTFPSFSPYDLCQDFVLENDLKQLINEPTLGKNLLDLLFCTEQTFIDNVSVSEGFSTSHHSSLCFSMLCARPKVVKTWVRDFQNANFDEIERFLSSISWYDELSRTYGMCFNAMFNKQLKRLSRSKPVGNHASFSPRNCLD